MEALKVGDKVHFRTADGKKHFGTIDALVPSIDGSNIYSVKCPALGAYVTVEKPEKLKRKSHPGKKPNKDEKKSE